MYKSKFKTFILSLIPGFGHYYIGATNRGAIFTFSAISYIFLASLMDGYSFLGYYSLGSSYTKFITVGLAFLWLFSIIDALNLRKGLLVNQDPEYQPPIDKDNDKLIAVLLSIIPGLGHFYLKRYKEGIRLLSLFLVVYLVYSIVPLQVLSLIMVLLIIYTLMNLKDVLSNDPEGGEEGIELSQLMNHSYMKYLGIGFIVIGILVLFNKIAISFIDTELLMKVLDYMREGIIAAVLIILGIKLILMNKIRKGDDSETMESGNN